MGSDQNILVKLNKAGFSLNNKWLVKGVSLQVEKGKIVTLIGPNGSGKSTTAKIALGIYKKIDGSVEKYTNKVGYVPQKISIDWTLPLRVNDFMVLTESLNKETIDELFHTASWTKKLYIASSGIIVNFVLAWLILFSIFTFYGVEQPTLQIETIGLSLIHISEPTRPY